MIDGPTGKLRWAYTPHLMSCSVCLLRDTQLKKSDNFRTVRYMELISERRSVIRATHLFERWIPPRKMLLGKCRRVTSDEVEKVTEGRNQTQRNEPLS
ncbi:hypothetical protein RUM43_002094 [Polyplax serrata]|uniref:Uncharacterized protein n=1 Tax=Polyplax serrata TaxID=468196 RepID=A0AAN8S4F8_POLSC